MNRYLIVYKQSQTRVVGPPYRHGWTHFEAESDETVREKFSEYCRAQQCLHVEVEYIFRLNAECDSPVFLPSLR